MKGLLSGFYAVALCAAAGCVSAPVPPQDRRVTIAEDLGTDVHVTDVRCLKGAGGFQTFQANVVNNTRSDLGVEWKIQWYDADGVEIESAVSSWNKIMIAPKDFCGLKGTAPRADAADLRFHVRELRR